MDNFFLDHMQDLSDRAEQKNIYTFSDFLSVDELSALLLHRHEFTFFEVYGGIPGTERNVVRFGDPAQIGYAQDFPVVCLMASPLNAKFADQLTHRDVLGSVMNLGLQRAQIGDIIIRDENVYLFCISRIYAFICENLKRIRHTDVAVSVCADLPEGALYETEDLRFTVSSLRFDCIGGAALHLSRSKMQLLFQEKKVFLNGAECTKPDAVLCEGDVFSVRGFGKFRFKTESGVSKKGKRIVIVEKYK